jgi:Kdo2-lipid IVA lauroyltransferase/acyltransferase
MKAIVFYISLPFIYLISILPFRILYLLSDFLYFIVYRVIRYRKKIVFKNLRNSFPQKSEKEIRLIAREFYHFFCDWILEMIKSLTISKEESIKRCHFTDRQILNDYAKQNKNLIYVMGHNGNFEYGGPEMEFNSPYQLHVVYKPQSNKYFDALIKKKRMRFGTGVIPMNSVYKDMIKLKEKSRLFATLFISDQTPQPSNAYWTTFLNQETPIFWGTEIIAKKLNYPVIYISMKRTKRGFYEMTLEILCENPKEMATGELTEMHTRRLEQDIIDQPEIWLWSHRRWKHQRPKQIQN